MQMNPRYLQRFGEPPPFGDTIARAALRDDPDAPYGEPALGDNEGQRLFEQPDVQPSMNKHSLVAADDPYANYGAESGNDAGARQFMQPQYGSSTKPNLPAPVNDPYLNYDPEVPIREARQSFQPPPTIESNALKSIVSIDDAPERDPGRLSQPPVIDTRELPTAPPPESTLQRLIRERINNKAPERGPVSKWAKLAAVALGAGQGYYNAANPNAKPIDASEAVQNLTFGRKYLDAMGKYQRTNKNLDEQIKSAADVEQVETNRAYREATAADQRRREENQDDARQAAQGKVFAELADKGYSLIDESAPLPDGYTEQPGFNKNGKRMVRNPYFDQTIVTEDLAKQFKGLRVGERVKTKDLTSALLKPAAGSQIRNMNQSVSVTDALANVASGVGEYYKPNGNPWTLPELKALQGSHQGLQGVIRGNEVMYIPFTPRQKTVIFDNQVVGVTPFTIMDANKTGDTGNTVLGQARTGQTVSNTPTTVVLDAQGVPHVMGSTSQTTPTTFNRTTSQRPTSDALQSGEVMPPAPNRLPVQQPPVVTPQRVGDSGPQPRMALGVTPGMHKDFTARAGPVRAVVTQIFGDPANPEGIPSMRKFAYLADDPGARQRIGDAIRILLANDDHLAIGNAAETKGWSGGGHVGSGVMLPLSVGMNGGMNRSGTQATPTLDPAQVQAINRQIADVVGRLKPGDEREAVIASLKQYEEVGGLRKIFSGGNALAIISQMQKTLPMIGFNDTLSSAQFHSKLTRTAEDAANGKWGIPKDYFGADVVETIERERRYVPNSPAGGGRGGAAPQPAQVPERYSPSRNKHEHSLDGGKTWLPGRAPK
jgi:hypothetical protein